MKPKVFAGTLLAVLFFNTAAAAVHTPALPDSITDYTERADYLISHYHESPYWSEHSLYKDSENLKAIAYLSTVATPRIASEALLRLLNSSFCNIDDYSNLAYYYDLYLGSPDSPWRNDDIFIKILDTIIESDLDEIYKAVPRFRKEALMKNRPGTPASDLMLTSMSGEVVKLSRYEGKTLLVVFASAGCHECESGLKKLSESERVRSAIKNEDIHVVVLFIDNAFPDYTELLDNFDLFRDNDNQIFEQEIYTARILPSLYLLDATQKVIMREETVEAFLSGFPLK